MQYEKGGAETKDMAHKSSFPNYPPGAGAISAFAGFGGGKSFPWFALQAHDWKLRKEPSMRHNRASFLGISKSDVLTSFNYPEVVSCEVRRKG